MYSKNIVFEVEVKLFFWVSSTIILLDFDKIIYKGCKFIKKLFWSEGSWVKYEIQKMKRSASVQYFWKKPFSEWGYLIKEKTKLQITLP